MSGVEIQCIDVLLICEIPALQYRCSALPNNNHCLQWSLEESFPVEEKESKQAKGEENKSKVEEIRRKSDEKLWSDQIGASGSMT